MNGSRTILFNPPNRLGLGHINRLSAIALALRELDASVRLLFAIEGSGHVLLDALSLPYLPLPSSHALYETDAWNGWTRPLRSKLQLSLANAVLKSAGADVVVIDCFTSAPFALAAIEQRIPIVLCLREMKNLAAYVHLIDDFLPHIRMVLIPHERHRFEVPKELAAISRFVGQIARPRRQAHEASAGRVLKQIVISGGGGGYPETVQFYNLALQAVAGLRRRIPELNCLLVTGPLFQEWEQLQLRDGIRIVPFDPDLESRFATADLVICQAGYNTIAEIERSAQRAICIPAARDFDDQDARADDLAGRRSNFVVFRGTPAELAPAIENALGLPVDRAWRNTQGNGASEAAACLIELLSSNHPEHSVV
jgi:predicted glycosyltransferase